MKSFLAVLMFLGLPCFAMSAGEVANTLGYSAAPPNYQAPQAQVAAPRAVLCSLRRNAAMIPGLPAQISVSIPVGRMHGAIGVDRYTGYAFSFTEFGRTVYARTAAGRVAVYACRR